MIDSRDLRIGNILKLNDKPTIVYGFYKEFINHGNIESPCKHYDNLFEPIALTEKIMLQCGATSCGYGMFDLNHMTINLVHKMFYSGSTDISCEFLHDLQNLYYHHNSKKELPINIETLEVWG